MAERNLVYFALGDWDRTMMLELEGGKAVSYTPFAEGWLDEEKDDVFGRPVDVELMPDGSMLVSDDYADVIYRIRYVGK
jgi:glucose/arabinose dehydrogenase